MNESKSDWCRAKAAGCRAMTNHVSEPELRARLEAMAAQWIMLAELIEMFPCPPAQPLNLSQHRRNNLPDRQEWV
jgi:hypothetical protein